MILTEICESLGTGNLEKVQSFVSEHQSLFLKIEGADWNGKINYRLALLITELQKALYASGMPGAGFSVDSMLADGLEVQAEITNGCSLVTFSVGKLVKNIINKMTGTQLTILLCAVGAMCAFCYGKTVAINAEKEIALRKEDANIANNAVNATLKAMNEFARTLNESDRLTVNNGITYSKQDFLKEYEPVSDETAPEQQSYFIDGFYCFDKISNESRTFNIKIDNKSRKAIANKLTKEQFKQLLSKQADALDTEKPPCEHFQISAMFLAGAVKRLTIDGIGPQRSGAVTFADAKNESIEKEESKDPQ